MSEQVFHPYTAWEDWRNGLWRNCVAVTGHMEAAAHILGDPDVFADGARAMLRDWPNAAEHNLTNREQNRRAWIGQATCCYLAAVPESATRFGWWMLTDAERDEANTVADRVILEWEAEREAHARPQLFPLEVFRSA